MKCCHVECIADEVAASGGGWGCVGAWAGDCWQQLTKRLATVVHHTIGMPPGCEGGGSPHTASSTLIGRRHVLCNTRFCSEPYQPLHMCVCMIHPVVLPSGGWQALCLTRGARNIQLPSWRTSLQSQGLCRRADCTRGSSSISSWVLLHFFAKHADTLCYHTHVF